MSKNIEMNYKIDSGYEVIYPSTTAEQAKSLSINGGTLNGPLYLYGNPSQDNEAVNLGYLNDIISSKISMEIIQRRGTGNRETVSVIFSFVPQFILVNSNEGGGFGIWSSNNFSFNVSNSGSSGFQSMSASFSGNVLSWQSTPTNNLQGRYYLNDKNSVYDFIAFLIV